MKTQPQEKNMQFDVIVGNPPYQELKPGNKTSKAIWHKFVDTSLDLLSTEGYLNFVHPSGWRNFGGQWKNLSKKMLSKRILYLNINDVATGIETFGAATRYDWCVIKNEKASGKTAINCQDGNQFMYELKDLDFIPNGKFDEVFNLVANAGESRCHLFNDSSYHSQRQFMSKEKTKKNIFPCIINIGKGDKITRIWWSETNKKGHFGIKKIIFGKFGANIFLDSEGEYGLCEHASAITEEESSLPLLRHAMQSEEFVKLMKYCDVGGLGTAYNHRVIALFRKDFWKGFIDKQSTP